jgi:uncharacterized protein
MKTLSDVVRAIAEDPALASIARDVAPRLAADPAHDLAHCERVALWTLRIGAGAVNPRLAIAAALLHDAVDVPKDSPLRARASEASAEHARAVLAEQDFSAEEIELVAGAIRDHSFSRGATPETALGKALQDADRLEALGAIGLARCLITGARMGAQPFEPSDPFARDRERDERRFSVDHFFTKLFTLPDKMQTEAGRAEAQRRVEILRQFLAALASELEVTPSS